MPTYIQGAGQTALLNSSSTGPGTWIGVHPNIRGVTIHLTHTGSSVGATVSSTVYIEASNDGVNAIATKLATLTPTSLASPAVDGFAIDAHWNYIRANINSISTGIINVIASGIIQR